MCTGIRIPHVAAHAPQALAVQDDALPSHEARAQAQLVVGLLGAVVLLAGNLPAWRGQWKLWAAIETIAVALFAAWLVVASPIGLA